MADGQNGSACNRHRLIDPQVGMIVCPYSRTHEYGQTGPDQQQHDRVAVPDAGESHSNNARRQNDPEQDFVKGLVCHHRGAQQRKQHEQNRQCEAMQRTESGNGDGGAVQKFL